MKLTAKITSKGQITVPMKIREQLGVKVGDKIVFDRNDKDEITVRPARDQSPFAKYRGIGTPGIGSGRKSVIKAVRDIRGFDPDEAPAE